MLPEPLRIVTCMLAPPTLNASFSVNYLPWPPRRKQPATHTSVCPPIAFHNTRSPSAYIHSAQRFWISSARPCTEEISARTRGERGASFGPSTARLHKAKLSPGRARKLVCNCCGT